MRQHVQIVAWLYLALGVIGVLGALLVFGVMGGIGAFSGDAAAGATLAVIGLVIAGMIALLSVPSILGGWGLLQGKPWARMLVLILSVLNLVNIPIGTLIGAYAIWVLMQDESRVAIDQGV